MHQKRAAIILIVACVLAGCKPRTPGPSARLYLDVFEIERYASHADPLASLITTRFRLLERSEVQIDLGLSQDQMLAIRTAYNIPLEGIPGLSDEIAERKEQKGDVSEDERRTYDLESGRRVRRRMADFYGKKLIAILTPQQYGRLEELLRQAHGPVVILVQTNLASALAIHPEQMKNLATQVHDADREIIPALQKFGRGFIADHGPGETEETREREMNELLTSLRRMISLRDTKILDALSEDQRETWMKLQGRRLRVEWAPWDLMKTPFEEDDS